MQGSHGAVSCRVWGFRLLLELSGFRFRAAVFEVCISDCCSRGLGFRV